MNKESVGGWGDRRSKNAPFWVRKEGFVYFKNKVIKV